MDITTLINDHFGARKVNLARALGVSKQLVGLWTKRPGVLLPARFVLPTYQHLRGAVTPHDLRPDLYPDADYRPALAAEQTDGAAA